MANRVLRGSMKVVYNGEVFVIHPETEIEEIEGYVEDVEARIANNIVKRNSYQFPSNEIFSKGVILFEEDTGIVKFGDGSTAYENLPLASRANIDSSNVTGLEELIQSKISDSTIQAAKVIGVLSEASVSTSNVTGLSGVIKDVISESTIAANKVSGILNNATVASYNINGDINASKIVGNLSNAMISSSNVNGNISASKVVGALNNASIASNKITGLTDAITTQVSNMSISGSKIVGDLTNASVPASKISITDVFEDIGYDGSGTLEDLVSMIVTKMAKAPIIMTSEEFKNNNPVISAGQLAFESDTGVMKIGDGINTYTELKYEVNSSETPAEPDPQNPDIPSGNVVTTNFTGMNIVGSDGEDKGTIEDNSLVKSSRIEITTNDGSSVTFNTNNLVIGTDDSHSSNAYFEINE